MTTRPSTPSWCPAAGRWWRSGRLVQLWHHREQGHQVCRAEGRLRSLVDTIVVMKNSEKKDAAMKFINFILDASNHAWAAENILYKVPNRAAMESLDKALIEQYPNMGMTPEELTKYELLRDPALPRRTILAP